MPDDKLSRPVCFDGEGFTEAVAIAVRTALMQVMAELGEFISTAPAPEDRPLQ